MKIDEIRKDVDKLDRMIVQILGERAKLASKMADIKRENGIQLHQLKREKEMIKSGRILAGEFGVNPDLVESIFKAITKDSYAIQKNTGKS